MVTADGCTSRLLSPHSLHTHTLHRLSTPPPASTPGPSRPAGCSPPAASEPQPSAASAAPPAADPSHRRELGERLYMSAGNGTLEEAQRLLDAGADPSYANEFGWTPLMKASKKGSESVVSLLLQRGADVNAEDIMGMTALHNAAAHDRSGRCVAPLVAAGARVDCTTSGGGTPLQLAAVNNHEAAVRALLAAGASKTL